MNKTIDLHIHTNNSDGALSPKEIIDEASKNNISIISITDHDTIDGYNDELFNYAKEKDILLIPGVEISTKTNKCGIHVLGYNFDLNNTDLKETLKSLRNARHDYLYNVASKLNKLGYKLNLEELDKIKSVTKAHIANDIVSNPQNENILLTEFNHIPNKGEFIETILNEGCPAYVKKTTITPVEAANIIRNAGGKVVLAHPVAYKYEDDFVEKDILNLINNMEITAIEGYYLYVDRNNNLIDEISLWKKFANENNLICTIGTDFHNFNNISPTIGFNNYNIEISNEEIKNILDFITNKKD